MYYKNNHKSLSYASLYGSWNLYHIKLARASILNLSWSHIGPRDRFMISTFLQITSHFPCVKSSVTAISASFQFSCPLKGIRVLKRFDITRIAFLGYRHENSILALGPKGPRDKMELSRAICLVNATRDMFVWIEVLRPHQHYIGHFGDVVSNFVVLLPDIEMKWHLKPYRPMKPIGFIYMYGPTLITLPGQA